MQLANNTLTLDPIHVKTKHGKYAVAQTIDVADTNKPAVITVVKRLSTGSADVNPFVLMAALSAAFLALSPTAVSAQSAGPLELGAKRGENTQSIPISPACQLHANHRDGMTKDEVASLYTFS